MPFIVKKTENNNVADINVFDELDLITKRIEYLKRLKGGLSDEDFTKIIAFCYDYDMDNFDEDVMQHTKDIFGEEFKWEIIDTDLLFSAEVDNDCYIRFDACVKASLEIKPSYTLSELENLIFTRQMIIGFSCLREKATREESKDEMSPEAKNRAFSLILSCLPLTDLGPYKEWLLPIIKSAFTDERVARDILELLTYAKELISMCKASLEEETASAELLIANNNEAIGRLDAFNENFTRVLD